MEPLRVVGRYAIFDEIAAGGMATVHLGRLIGPVGFARTVAIKRLHEQLSKDPEFVSMFIDEARVAARVRHPNVVPTLDVLEADGQLLLVMEYVHGLSLSTLARLARKAGKRVPPRIACAIVAGMLRGLHAAHEAKDEQGRPLEIVHRDVSPHNVLVGTDGVPRVLDFGVAKATGRLQQTAQGQLKGKVPYMAPEQVRGEAVSRRSDVWSSGACLWEALVGRRLFDHENEAAVITLILSRPIEAPSKFDDSAPKAIDPIVMRALERDPEKRFPTARDMAQAIEESVPTASPAEIGEWVDAIATDFLKKRSELVAEVERTSAADAPMGAALRISGDATPISKKSGVSTVSLSTSTPPPRPRSRSLLYVVVALLGLSALVVVGFFALRKTGPVEPSTSAKPVSSVEAKPSASVSVSVSASAISPPVASSPEPKPSVTTKAPVYKIKGPAAAPKEDCDPPFTYDAKGKKTYKVNCL
ncbi:MAG: serine/threonine-protein kinase [Polyangiales bacterium]